MLITDAIPTPTFANHESFHLRYSWLKKAYDATLENDRIFVSDDATIKLGVGKNMVRAIRFWSLASKILESGKGRQNSSMSTTSIGKAIFDDSNGLDPYLEDPQTLWLLHWLLFAPPCRIPVWWIIMNEFSATKIERGDLFEHISQRITNLAEWKTPSPKSLKKDIDVFLHTYTTEQGNIPIEEYLDCPFRQMRMIKQNSQDVMRFVFGRKFGMTPEIVTFACMDFLVRCNLSSKSISVSELATKSGCVGNAFKLAENELGEMLGEACRTSSSLRMETVNGALRLVYDDAVKSATEMLGMAYNIDAPNIYPTKEVLTS